MFMLDCVAFGASCRKEEQSATFVDERAHGIATLLSAHIGTTSLSARFSTTTTFTTTTTTIETSDREID
jgi:hypothetical protein